MRILDTFQGGWQKIKQDPTGWGGTSSVCLRTACSAHVDECLTLRRARDYRVVFYRSTFLQINFCGEPQYPSRPCAAARSERRRGPLAGVSNPPRFAPPGSASGSPASASAASQTQQTVARLPGSPGKQIWPRTCCPSGAMPTSSVVKPARRYRVLGRPRSWFWQDLFEQLAGSFPVKGCLSKAHKPGCQGCFGISHRRIV